MRFYSVEHFSELFSVVPEMSWETWKHFFFISGILDIFKDIQLKIAIFARAESKNDIKSVLILTNFPKKKKQNYYSGN